MPLNASDLLSGFDQFKGVDTGRLIPGVHRRRAIGHFSWSKASVMLKHFDLTALWQQQTRGVPKRRGCPGTPRRFAAA
jgi:hypothetical protein